VYFGNGQAMLLYVREMNLKWSLKVAH